MKAHLLFASFALFAGASFSQIDYNFASTGQQKLLINPAFCASSEGLNVQTLAAFKSHVFANYTGASYSSAKGFGIGISNAIFTQKYTGPGFYENNVSNQTSLSLAYRIKLGSKVSLIPSVQASFFTVTEKYSTYYDYKNNGASFSSGLVMDINKTLTFGAAFFNMRSSSLLYFTQVYFTQVYHASLLLCKNKKVNFQPYGLVKIYSFVDEGYAEIGAYTTYKLFALQTAYRGGDNNYGGLTAGLSVKLAGIKFGYTFSKSLKNSFSNVIYNELFISARLFNPTKGLQRNLMLD